MKAKRNEAKELKDFKNRWWLKYGVTIVVLTGITLLSALVQGAFAEVDKIALLKFNVNTELQCRLQQWSNAFAVAGALGVCFGGLVILKSGSLVDLIVRAFRALILTFKQDAVDRKYRNFNNYKKALKEKRRSYWCIAIVGAVFVGISAALIGLLTVA